MPALMIPTHAALITNDPWIQLELQEGHVLNPSDDLEVGDDEFCPPYIAESIRFSQQNPGMRLVFDIANL